MFQSVHIEEFVMVAIHLDSSASQTVSRAVPKAAVLSCTQTSAPDVYAQAIWTVVSDVRQFTLHTGDSMFVPDNSTLTIWIFRKQPGSSKWTADFDLS
ncbi:hypothetical protein JQ615_28605 [Bradyrhizobium jicamae]|uniref:Uncharacterized protein n=1 Tax=Bradyrhizobium jicamae TaxID=280332 RepID=A0ABS5FRB9_9BRAD|nr:hypothetical protein [Bradyrhizobium jicamae]MBR0799354.1 hypothetical protein [Bradyrhizobium jicamae]